MVRRRPEGDRACGVVGVDVLGARDVHTQSFWRRLHWAAAQDAHHPLPTEIWTVPGPAVSWGEGRERVRGGRGGQVGLKREWEVVGR